MPVDINLFRTEEGLKVIRKSQESRGAPISRVESVVALDSEWRKVDFEVNQLNKEKNASSKNTGKLKGDAAKLKKELATKTGEEAAALEAKILQLEKEADDLIAGSLSLDARIVAAKARRDELLQNINKLLHAIGNVVHESVPVSMDEANNRVEKVHGDKKSPVGYEGKLYHHHELLEMIDGYSPEQGVRVAGHRGFFLRNHGAFLNAALQRYGLAFLSRRGYTVLQTPFFMRKDVMAKTAQLEEFDEALYHVRGENEQDFYLIATSEQPISAYHMDERIEPKDLPIKYAGISTCFRKEAGSHGRDAWGVFRIHQFEKVEQFVLCEPEKSWKMQEEMLGASEEFYKSLGLSYHVINIVSGALNNAAARKLDLEAWFPTLAVYRELVSCSNCTDYQARAMETRLGGKKAGEQQSEFVHMLNATMTATERTMCCLLENYQVADGIIVPEVLRPYMEPPGLEKIPFVKPPPKHQAGEGTVKKEKDKEKTEQQIKHEQSESSSASKKD